MPITKELKNIKKFESVGFTHDQAEALTESLEESVTSGNESLKEFILQQNKELRNELKQDIKDLEIRILESQRDLMIRFITIVTAIVGIATAIIKLF